MKVVITTDNMFVAYRLKSEILSALNNNDCEIKTWTFEKAKRGGQDVDIIYHNPSQYTNNPKKNVLFRVVVIDNNVQFFVSWWKNHPVPSRDMICLHIGRLTEMLLCNFSTYIRTFSVLDMND